MKEGQGWPIIGLYHLLCFCDFDPRPLPTSFNIIPPRAGDEGLWRLAGCSHQRALRSHFMVLQLTNHPRC